MTTHICKAIVKKTGKQCTCKAKDGTLFCGRPKANVVQEVHICKAIVKKTEKPCACKAKDGTLFCGRHKANVVQEEEEEEVCSICLSSVKEKVKFTCKHEFCSECIQKWKMINMICPCCRSPLVKDEKDVIEYVRRCLNDISSTDFKLEKIKINDRLFKVFTLDVGKKFVEKYPKFKKVLMSKFLEFKQFFNEYGELTENFKKAMQFYYSE